MLYHIVRRKLKVPGKLNCVGYWHWLCWSTIHLCPDLQVEVNQGHPCSSWASVSRRWREVEHWRGPEISILASVKTSTGYNGNSPHHCRTHTTAWGLRHRAHDRLRPVLKRLAVKLSWLSGCNWLRTLNTFLRPLTQLCRVAFERHPTIAKFMFGDAASLPPPFPSLLFGLCRLARLA